MSFYRTAKPILQDWHLWGPEQWLLYQRAVMLLLEVRIAKLPGLPTANGRRPGHPSWRAKMNTCSGLTSTIKTPQSSGKLSRFSGQFNYLCLHQMCLMLLNSSSKWVCFGTAALAIDSTAPVMRSSHVWVNSEPSPQLAMQIKSSSWDLSQQKGCTSELDFQAPSKLKSFPPEDQQSQNSVMFATSQPEKSHFGQPVNKCDSKAKALTQQCPEGTPLLIPFPARGAPVFQGAVPDSWLDSSQLPLYFLPSSSEHTCPLLSGKSSSASLPHQKIPVWPAIPPA